MKSEPVSKRPTAEFPQIDPVRDGVERPYWSVMIPTHNRVDFLEKTLTSVLDQDFDPKQMQIEVVDDSTAADVEAIVKSVGRNRVGFYHLPEPVGLSNAMTMSIQRGRGHWVHILHDDDMVMPGFYGSYKRFIESQPDAMLVFSRAISIDEKDQQMGILYTPPNQPFTGLVSGANIKLVEGDFICAPTAVVARQAYERAGGFLRSLSHACDWEMWMRISTIGAIGYIHEPLLRYRIHSGSDTSQRVARAENMEDIVHAIEIGVRRLPAEKQQATRVRAFRHYSHYASSSRSELHSLGQHRAAFRHAIWAFKLDYSILNLMKVARSGVRAFCAHI